MTFAECANKSVNHFIALIEIDILEINLQWVNNGAGVWVCNFTNSYPWVDNSLLDGFTTQDFGDIGSVQANGISLLRVSTLLEVGQVPGTFYYNPITKDLYISNPNFDSPYSSEMNIGILYGFTNKSFNPVDSNTAYDNRIMSFPEVSFSRDPLFFGKLSYSDISFSIANGDGAFDTFANDNNIYGNPARVKLGFEEISINDYITIYTGYIGGAVGIDEENVSFTIADKRQQLSKKINYSCINKNALEAIEEIITLGYGWSYNSTLYNTINWEISRALVPNITIDTQEAMAVIELIEMICNTAFGVFTYDPDGRFNFMVIDDDKPGADSICKEDVLNTFAISYDPSQVISSTKIGYARNWSTSAYSILNDISYEEAVYDKYKTYTQKDINTLLVDLASAQEFSDKIMLYNKDVHGTLNISLPIKYYSDNMGDNILIEIDRVSKAMLYLRKCEILNKTYNLETGMLNFNIRIIKEMFVRITTDGKIRILSDGRMRVI